MFYREFELPPGFEIAPGGELAKDGLDDKELWFLRLPKHVN